MDRHDASEIAREARRATEKVSQLSAEVITISTAIGRRDPEVQAVLLRLNVMITSTNRTLANLSKLLTFDAIAQGTSIPDVMPDEYRGDHD